MATQYRYQYEIKNEANIEAHVDGSGMVKHHISMQSQEVDEAGDPVGDPEIWDYVPGRSQDFNAPADEMVTALTGAGKAQKYKNMLVANKDTQNTPITGWEPEEVTLFYNNNDKAAAARQTLLDWLGTLGEHGEFPVDFQLDL